MVGIVVDPAGDLDGVETARRTLLAAGVVPLVIGPHGGEIDGTVVQRTFATVRSVEVDAVLVAGAFPPAPDALPARDAKAGADQGSGLDPRVQLLLDECFRHGKAIGAWGDGQAVLTALGLDGQEGVVLRDDAAGTLADVQELMAAHRVWERFPTRL
jgi:catalase